MSRRASRFFANAAVLFSLVSGCGAVLNGPTQLVRVWSVPPGADVQTGDKKEKSPVKLFLAREKNHEIRVSAEGFEPRTVEVRSVPDPNVRFANCFFLCIPLLWESGDPSHYRLEPEEVDVNLDPVGWSPR